TPTHRRESWRALKWLPPHRPRDGIFPGIYPNIAPTRTRGERTSWSCCR
ncbi:unnamed protein product, partial [Ectocarpus sp. 12 AP-2014]